MGLSSHCRKCDFRFASGHSHHTGSSSALCVACLADFVLPTRSPWGPSLGEVIELHRQTKAGLVGTEEIFEAVRGEHGGVHYALEETACPDCKTKGSLATYFLHDTLCPVCKRGRLWSDLVIY
jgi:hypothetical protein